MGARLAFVAVSAAIALLVAVPAALFVANAFASAAGALETISKESNHER